MARSSVDNPSVPLVRDYGDIASLVWQGKVFHANNPTIGTAVTGQTSYAATLSTWTLRNVGSKVLVPLYLNVAQSGTVAGGRIIYHISTLETGQFTSGTALTAYNANSSSGNAPSVLPYHTATLPTFTTSNQRLRKTGELFQSVTAAAETNPQDLFPAAGFVAVRPGGQLDVYTWAGTTGPSWSFNIAWAELEV